MSTSVLYTLGYCIGFLPAIAGIIVTRSAGFFPGLLTFIGAYAILFSLVGMICSYQH